MRSASGKRLAVAWRIARHGDCWANWPGAGCNGGDIGRQGGSTCVLIANFEERIRDGYRDKTYIIRVSWQVRN